jgi:signal transduction histidine kinase
LAIISSILKQTNSSSLRISDTLPIKQEFCLATSKKHPLLSNIIDKALVSITTKERESINHRWSTMKSEFEVDYQLLWQMALVFTCIFIGFFYWNRRLSSEVLLRQETEKMLVEAKEAAEKANVVKSAFLANMSHELRTPLNSIIGFTGIILRELAGPLNFEQKKQLRMVKGSSEHLLSLINDVLDISKIESGEMEVSTEVFNICDVVNNVFEIMAPLAENKGLVMNLHIEMKKYEVENDQRRLSQILINLVNNAIKFTEKGNVDIFLKHYGSGFEIKVSDTGIGISEEDLEKIFIPFQQLDIGTSRKFEGTGLGLAICERLAAILGLKLSVQSQKNEGSTFILKGFNHQG